MKVMKEMDDIFVYSENSKAIIGLKRSDLSTLTIPEGVVKIDYKVLADCKNLQTIALPNSLDSFGSFDGCDNLRSISVGSTVKTRRNLLKYHKILRGIVSRFPME